MITINGINWDIVFVEPDDPVLWMGDGYTIGVTDLDDLTIYVANGLDDNLLQDVLQHECCHALMFSYEIFMDISSEECVCQIMELFSDELDILADQLYNEL